MLTQCPNCRTLFRVKPEQLEIADGKVRCSQCNQVFNALVRLRKSPDEHLQSDRDGQQETEADLQEEKPSHFADTSTPSPAAADDTKDSEDTTLSANVVPQSTDKEDECDPESIYELNDGLEPAPDYLDVGTESQMSELLDQDTEASLLIEDDTPSQPAEVVDIVFTQTPTAEPPEEMSTGEFKFSESILRDDVIESEEGWPDYDSIPAFRETSDTLDPSTEPLIDEKTLTFEADEYKKPKKKSTKYWLIGSALLLLLLGGQLTWQYRQELIQYDIGRQVVGRFCQVLGCEIPIRRDTSKIIIQGRNLSSDPNNPDILVMQLHMVNTASYEQPYPKLQLSLFDDNGKLIARRIFTAAEYLSDYDNLSMMPKAISILAEMQVVDPGDEVTGFSFDFL